jgi:hypothetical protein
MVSGAPWMSGRRPSGAAHANALLPMVPDAPVRFSTTTSRKVASDSPGAHCRASTNCALEAET